VLESKITDGLSCLEGIAAAGSLMIERAQACAENFMVQIETGFLTKRK
jgi:hypothetical protein